MIDLVPLIKTVGYVGLFGIVFAESGLFIGFFLPGDSLLFTAGFLASQGFLNIGFLAATTFVAAVLGDGFGYAFGKKLGPSIFKKEDSLFFHKDNLEKARIFYERHGKMTIVIARFLPFIRTFAPILAGVGKMRYKTFLFYNIFGALVWTVGLTTAGYFLGVTIPDAHKYVFIIVAVILILSVFPPALHIIKNKQRRENIWKIIKEKLGFTRK